MQLSGLDQLWVADITYVHLAEEFGYLAIVLDAFSRKVVGWVLETHLRAELAIAALDMAIAARRPIAGSLIHHSDRGVQYACGDYTKILRDNDIQPSMSRVGNPYDNAKAESFMKTLKQEEVDGSAYRDVTDARARIGYFVVREEPGRRRNQAICILGSLATSMASRARKSLSSQRRRRPKLYPAAARTALMRSPSRPLR